MTERTRADRDEATESKFYLPAGVTPSSEGSRLGAVWARLVRRSVDPGE